MLNGLYPNAIRIRPSGKWLQAWKLRVVRTSVGVGEKGTQISKINFCLPSVIIGNLLQGLSGNLRQSEILNAFAVLKQILSNFPAEFCLT